MDNVLVGDDSIYEELYDVRREAEHIGNLVEEDMNPRINALRDRAPVQKGFLRELLGLPPHNRYGRAADSAGFTCFSWTACETAFRDHQRFSTTILAQPSETGERRLGFLEMDEPEHLAQRRPVQPMFIKPRAESWWRPRWIGEIVDLLIAKLATQQRAELNLQLCARVPVHTISRAIGLGSEDALVFRHALLRSSSPLRVSPEERKEAAATVERMLLGLIATRRGEPADDLISRMVQAEMEMEGERRPLTDREIFLTARLILLAGGGTSWRQMGITLWALLTHLDQLEAVKSDRALIDQAIEESVRWNPTDPVFSRIVTGDTELEWVPMPAGSVLEICLGAANRDPARWDNPDAYDLHRPQQPHMGFGIGAHQCLGRNVAHSQISAAINALLDAFPDIRLDPDAPAPYLTGGLEQRGISALPVLLR